MAAQSISGPGNSMLYSFLLFVVTLSLQQMYKEKLASTELYTIFGGFVSALIFLLVLTFIGNFQETMGARTGWGAALMAEFIALVTAGSVHRVCITTCFLFSVGILYEVNKLSGSLNRKVEVKSKKFI